MALPVAHSALALGLSRGTDLRVPILICVLCVLPDFDFALVWGLGLPLESFHRTFAHSLSFYGVLTLLWARWVPTRWRLISPGLFFAVLLSHSVYDILCTADSLDHGVMILWPLSEYRAGWPVLVPLYRIVADSPFTLQGAVGFTALEVVLAWPLWRISRVVRSLWERI